MNLRIYSAWIAGLTSFALPASANLKASDFYCRAIPRLPPEIFAMKAGACDKGAAAPGDGSVCVEHTYCVYVPESVRAFMFPNEKGESVPFGKLPYADRTKLLVKYTDPASWKPSMLTCPKKSDKLSLECPPVEECKGDITYGLPMAGAYSDKAVSNYKGNFNPDAFQAGEESAQ